VCLYQSLFIPVYAYAVCCSCATLAGRQPTDPAPDLVSPVCWRVTAGHVTATVLKVLAWFLDTFQVRRCWIKIDSAVNLGEKPNSEFTQSVLRVIQLTKAVESICCAVCHSDIAESCLTNDTLATFSCAMTTEASRHWPFAASSMLPAVCSVSVVYHAVCQRANHLLLAASYNFWVTFSLLHNVIVFFPIARLSFSLFTALSHNYYITPIIKVIFCFQSRLLLISSFPHRLTAKWTIRGESDLYHT